jgi:flavin-dependent dehydrogenase
MTVALADALVPPIDKACGEGLMPDGLTALGRLGVSIPESGSHPFRGISLVNGKDRAAAHFPGEDTALGTRRTTLHSVLVSQAEREGVQLKWGTGVTGLHDVAARWIIGADGTASRVRKWAGLEACTRNTRRFGFRRHYRTAPWTDCMEIHWGPDCQIYATPASADEVCVALISRDPMLRLDEALKGFAQLRELLAGAEIVSNERGSVTASVRLRKVWRDRVALIGDASGSVDAITGEGLCLAFQQAIALADAIVAGDLRQYAAAHRRLRRRPAFMADFMLTLGESWARTPVIRLLAAHPALFAKMLSMHVGQPILPGAFPQAVLKRR